MPLAPGTRIGPHEVTSLLGTGGMGEVYRARDTALGRDVAIKVLPDAFARDPERLARFEREARTLATLNHPHIAQVYRLERSGGTSALVMELVEGPTLADRVATGPVPLDEAMAIAAQMADALETAHEQGIVHRDLKPANVKVRSDGTVKVLDFGLAKLVQREGLGSGPGVPGISELATLTSPALMTGAGVILGTAAYMAPEQARGRSVDKRADIWAFGCILYEMLTGQRAFRGEDLTETLAAVVRDQPDLSVIPARVRSLVARCLEKDPKARLRDLGDRSLLLDARQEATSAGKGRTGWVWPGVAAMASALAALAVWAPWRERQEPQAAVSFEVAPPPGTSLGGSAGFAPSPDGRLLAFVAISADGIHHLWIRSMDAASARMLPATLGQQAPATVLAWSPDSRSLAFNEGQDVRRVEVASGEQRSICDACGQVSSWSHDGNILTQDTRVRGINRIPTDGGSPTLVSAPTDGGTSANHQHPAFLPDGRHFVFHRASQDQKAGVYLGSLDQPPDRQESQRLVALRAQTSLAYTPAFRDGLGAILYMDEDKLMALPFDHDRLAVAGPPERIADGVGRGGGGYGAFSVSSAGVLAYRHGNDERTLTWFNRAGAVLGTAGQVQADVSLSPDGLWAAVASARAIGVELLDLRRGLRTRLAQRPARNGVWSPDGARVAFTSDAGSKIWVRLSNGARPEEAVFEGTGQTTPNDWSPDGRMLLYSAETDETSWDIWALPLDGDRKPRPIVSTKFSEIRAQFSPDSRWIAYESDESGAPQIYVSPFSANGVERTQRWTIASGREPRWRSDGKELFYRQFGEPVIMAVDIFPGPPFTAGTPTRLFPYDGPGPGAGSNAYFDVAPGGQRFLVNTFSPDNLAAPITVTLNWRAERAR